MKRLAIFLDGTWNTLNNNTNVWRLKSLTAETEGQRVYYSQGVGTQRGESVRGGVAGYGIDDEITNLYVPGEETNGTATARRYAIGLATAPIDNAITEFLPDVAKHIHVQIVVIQRIINQVASKDTGGT